MGRLNVKENEVSKFSEEIKKKEPITMQVCTDDFDWKTMQVILSDSRIEGGEPVNLITEMGATKVDKMYMKILKEYADVVVEESYRPWEKESTTTCWGLRFKEKKS